MLAFVAVVLLLLLQPAAWVSDLRSPDEVTWRLAAIELAHRGAESLPALDSAATSKDEALRQRIRAVIDASLLMTLKADQLDQHANLSALCKADLEKADRLASVFATREGASWGEVLGSDGPEPIGDGGRLREFAELRGFGVPAAVRLCKHESPVVRVYGLEMLRRLGATGQIAVIRAAADDSSRVHFALGDTVEIRTVGSFAAEILRTSFSGKYLKPSAEAQARDTIEALLIALDPARGPALVTRLRNEMNATPAEPWDDFWASAKPIVRAFYQATPANPKAGGG